VRNENPGAAGSGRGYAVTASWARAQDLYDHLLEYGLAAHIPHNLTFHVGDVIFYRA
jgi:hypothetical protein